MLPLCTHSQRHVTSRHGEQYICTLRVTTPWPISQYICHYITCHVHRTYIHLYTYLTMISESATKTDCTPISFHSFCFFLPSFVSLFRFVLFFRLSSIFIFMITLSIILHRTALHQPTPHSSPLLSHSFNIFISVLHKPTLLVVHHIALRHAPRTPTVRPRLRPLAHL